MLLPTPPRGRGTPSHSLRAVPIAGVIGMCWLGTEGGYWANLLRHTSFSVASDAQRTYRYASRRWLPRASSGSQLDPVPGARPTRSRSSLGMLLIRDLT